MNLGRYTPKDNIYEIANKFETIEMEFERLLSMNYADYTKNSIRFRAVLDNFLKVRFGNYIKLRVNTYNTHELNFCLWQNFTDGSRKHIDFEFDVQKVARKHKIESIL